MAASQSYVILFLIVSSFSVCSCLQLSNEDVKHHIGPEYLIDDLQNDMQWKDVHLLHISRRSVAMPVSLNTTMIANITSTEKTVTPIPSNATVKTPIPTNSTMVSVSTVPSVTTTAKPQVINVTIPPIPPTNASVTPLPKPEIAKILPHNLGENGTGIRQYKECNKTNSTPSCVSVSEPIMPEEGNSTGNEFNIDEFTEPQDKLLADNNITRSKNDTHDYYNSTFILDKEVFDDFWNNIINSGDLKINSVLSHSYRRAATVRLGFDFPFYGQSVKNVTIATGGFLYTGDYVHSWLAATQYIAPLMANFDTSLYNDSFVKYIDNGTQLTIIWENVVLQDRPKDGNFTFSTTLYKNGDMVFAYKTIPFPIETIQDTNHPVKVGLSDAFIIDKIDFFARRKTIYEYHRVDFRNHHISNNTLVKLTALSTCSQYNTCQSCLEHDTKFECTWCSKVKRCSAGEDRQRHEWLIQNCEDGKLTNVSKCPAEDNIVYHNDTGDKSSPIHTTAKNGAVINSSHPGNTAEAGASTGAIVVSLIALIAFAGAASWILYAYRNPHTTSGQFLIKYRPSQWSWRRGEARYTAATIHM